MRGGSFTQSYQLLRTMVQARPRRPPAGQRALRLAVLHAGERGARDEHGRARRRARSAWTAATSCSPSTTGSVASSAGRVDELDWMSVSGWVSRPGAELGTTSF